MDEITIGEKVYISSKRAAKITGYAKDYVGQLCREGRVEARLVGRSWYVLEDAIREHRFGKPVETAAEEAPEDAQMDRAATWQKPQYVPEMPVMVPSLAEKKDEEPLGTPAIADMQTAWREWFAEKKPEIVATETLYVPESDENEPEEAPADEIEEVNENLETEDSSFEERVPVQRVYDEEPAQRIQAARSLDIAPIQPISAPISIPTPRVPLKEDYTEMKKGGAKGFGGAAIRAALIVIMFLSVLVGMIGTGHAEKFLSGTSVDFGFQNSILMYLGGTSEYKSSL